MNMSKAENSVICPLCASTDVLALESVAGRHLKTLYARLIDVARTGDGIWTDCVYSHCATCDLRFFAGAETGDERFYNLLQEYPWYYENTKNEFAQAAQHIEPGMKVLDVGAGSGAFHAYAAEAEYVGLELSAGAQVAAGARGIDVRRQPVEDFAAAHPGSCDAVFSFQVLEHVANPGAFLGGCVNALREGGKLFISVPAWDGFPGRAVNAPLNLPPHHLSRWSRHSLENIARRFQLRLVSLEIEPLQRVHVSSAAHAQLNLAVRELLGLSPRCVDMSTVGRFAERLANVALRVGIRPPPRLGGHSAIAVYERVIA